MPYVMHASSITKVLQVRLWSALWYWWDSPVPTNHRFNVLSTDIIHYGITSRAMLC